MDTKLKILVVALAISFLWQGSLAYMAAQDGQTAKTLFHCCVSGALYFAYWKCWKAR